MSNKKISQLSVATIVNANDLIPIVQDGVNKAAPSSLLGDDISQKNIIYVSAAGNNSNSGKTLNEAVLDLPVALNKAKASSPSQSNQIVISCVDAHIGSNIYLEPNIHLNAPMLELRSTNLIKDSSTLIVREFNGMMSTALLCTGGDGSSPAYAYANKLGNGSILVEENQGDRFFIIQYIIDGIGDDSTILTVKSGSKAYLYSLKVSGNIILDGITAFVDVTNVAELNVTYTYLNGATSSQVINLKSLGFTPENVANKETSALDGSTDKYPCNKVVYDGLAGKQNTLTNPVTGSGTSGLLAKFNAVNSIVSSNTIPIPDLRGIQTLTDAYPQQAIVAFKQNSDDGQSGGYWTSLTLQGWYDFTGGYAYQMAFNGNTPAIAWRFGGIGSAWNAWSTILDSNNFSTLHPYTSENTASTLAYRDTNSNFKVNQVIESVTTTIASDTPIILTAASSPIQRITGGSFFQSVKLPNATTLQIGHHFTTINASSGTVTISNASGVGLHGVANNYRLVVTLVANGDINGTWDMVYMPNYNSWETVTLNLLGCINDTEINLYFKKIDDIVYLEIPTVAVAGNNTSSIYFSSSQIPIGYRPPSSINSAQILVPTLTGNGLLTIDSAGYLKIYYLNTQAFPAFTSTGYLFPSGKVSMWYSTIY